VVVVVTAAAVSAIVPPVAVPARSGGSPEHAASPGRRPLPMPRLPAVAARPGVYGVATVDQNGRVADTTVIGALRWGPGTRLTICERGGLVLAACDPDGRCAVDGQGHLRLPAPIRHWCGLTAGERLLLAADPERGLLVMHPPAALHVMITQVHAAVLCAEQA
jgi:hypothetical protein